MSDVTVASIPAGEKDAETTALSSLGYTFYADILHTHSMFTLIAVTT